MADGMDEIEAFEKEAEDFYRDTGFLAPGKSEAAAAIGELDFDRHEVRRLMKKAWNAGIKRGAAEKDADLASIADLLNTELRENGPIGFQAEGKCESIKAGIKRLVDNCRALGDAERERAVREARAEAFREVAKQIRLTLNPAAETTISSGRQVAAWCEDEARAAEGRGT